MAKRKPLGFWEKEENVIAEARKFMEEHSFETIPSSNKLTELGYSSLSVAISKYYGGFHKFRNLLGEEQKIREKGIWESLDYTIQQAEEIMEKHGFETLPSSDKLNELGYSSLGIAIPKYHGGFHKFRELLGEEPIRRKGSIWKSLDYTIQQAQEFMKEHNLETFPTNNKISELGYSGLSTAISRYHGGFHKFRKLLGQKPKRTEHRKWKSLDYTLQQLRAMMQEHNLETLPSQKKLHKLGYSGLSGAISTYHGGFHKFRKLLGEEQKRTANGLWKSLEYTIRQAREVITENRFNTLPSSDKLKELGYGGLSKGIKKYHGGFPVFRAALAGKQLPSEKENLTDLVRKYAE